MLERPICQIPKCSNGAMLLVHSKYICGECYFKIHQQKEKQQWENMINDNL